VQHFVIDTVDNVLVGIQLVKFIGRIGLVLRRTAAAAGSGGSGGNIFVGIGSYNGSRSRWFAGRLQRVDGCNNILGGLVDGLRVCR
jgi:hypothetical protein